MGLVDSIQKLFTERDNISNAIRLKGVLVPYNAQLKTLPYYVQQIEGGGDTPKETHENWTQEYVDMCLLEAKSLYSIQMSQYTGSVDAEGLAEIGWTENDIMYFQENGVDWMEEDNDKYLVSDYEKELYKSGELNISTYTTTAIANNTPEVVEWRNNIRWMPKINGKFASGVTFKNFEKMIGIPTLDFSNFTNASYLFSYCKELRCIPTLSFKRDATFSAANAFQYCTKLRTLNFNFLNVTSLSNTFRGCKNLMYIENMNLPKCTTFSSAFYCCSNLMALGNINVEVLNTLSNAFFGCTKLKTIPLFDTSKVTTMQAAFQNCLSLENIPEFDVPLCKNYQDTFYQCVSLIKLPNLAFNKPTTYSSMCINCTSLQTIPTTLDFSACTNITSMFGFCPNITEFNYKLDLNSVSSSAENGIKSFSSFITSSNITELSLGKYYNTSTTYVGRWCNNLTKISVDDFMGGTNLFGSCILENVTELNGELRGLNKSFSISTLPNLDRESIIRVINALEDVTSLETPPKLTIGGERLRILTAEEKAIATDKGWLLA